MQPTPEPHFKLVNHGHSNPATVTEIRVDEGLQGPQTSKPWFKFWCLLLAM